MSLISYFIPGRENYMVITISVLLFVQRVDMSHMFALKRTRFDVHAREAIG